MNTDRLQLLVDLSRLGSMNAVAEATGTSTSTVSERLAILAREMGTPLLEPYGRRVRLTPAGRRLVEHALGILAAVEAARLDVASGSEPNGTVRIAAFATAISRDLLPLVVQLGASHPRVNLLIREHEPGEAMALLKADVVDLAVTYDYNLAPRPQDSSTHYESLWRTRWGLGAPSGCHMEVATAVEVARQFEQCDWIVNSRNDADEVVIRTLASMGEFSPRITHQADTLDLVQGMIAAGLGVGLLPVGTKTSHGVQLIPLAEPDIVLRSYAVVPRGRLNWPPLVLVTRLLAGPAVEGRRP